MSELRVLPGGPEGAEPEPQAGLVPVAQRTRVVVHRMEGGLENGESEARALSAAGFPIFTQADPDRPRLIPLADIKYVVLGSVEDPNLEDDPGDKASGRKAILRFRDGEWIPAYMEPSQVNDGVGLAVKIRLAERQRVIPAVASSRALLELQFVDAWTAPTESPTPQRRRSDIEQAAARQGKDLHKLANDFRDRLALVRDAGLTTGDTLAFSRAVRTYLDRFLAEDSITLNPGEKSALADIILRAAVGYGPLDPLLHDRSVSEIMVNGPDQVFIERRGVLTKADVRFDDENQLLETIRRMVATTGRHIDGLNPMVDARLPDGSRVNAIIRPASIHGAALTIRKFKDAVLGIEDLKQEGSLSPAMAEFLQAAVLGRMNILVSGGTGSGKTTTLNVVARFIAHEHRPPNVEGKGELTIRQLLRNSLRMRPDRILVGEVRGAEALDMLQAMNTGHDGSMSTIHSNSARDALSRLETMVMMASIDIPFEAVRAQIASAVNLIVHQARMPAGRRKVAQTARGRPRLGPPRRPGSHPRRRPRCRKRCASSSTRRGRRSPTCKPPRRRRRPRLRMHLRQHGYPSRLLGQRLSRRSSMRPRRRRGARRCSPRRSSIFTTRPPTSTPDRRWRPPPRWLAPRPRWGSWRPPRADSPACCQPSARPKARRGRRGPPAASTR